MKQDISLNFNNQAWIHIISIVIFSTIFAEITFFKSLELLSSSNVSMISMVEPVFTTLFALVFLNERLQFSQLTGGMFVLISLVVLVYSQNKSIKKPAINRTLIQNEHI